MRGYQRYGFLLAFALCALWAPGLSLAAPVGAFTKVEGGVNIHRLGEGAAVPVQAGDPVSQGDAIRTKRNGKAEIRFLDETVIQLSPETRITIDEYSYRAGNVRGNGLIGLFRGKLRSLVSKLKGAVVSMAKTGSSFSVRTPTAIAGVKGTDFIVYYERGSTGVVFLEGQGFVYNPQLPGNVVYLSGGQETFVPGSDDVPIPPRPATGGDPGGWSQIMPVIPPGPQDGNIVNVPITEMHPELIPTPVALTITIP